MNSEWAYLGESFHVALDDLRVWTLEFLDDIEALVELSEHVGDGTRKQSVLGCLLELYASRYIHTISGWE